MAYMKAENYTSNDYELTFNLDEIPPNLKNETLNDLYYILNKTMPITKKLHLMVGESGIKNANGYSACSKLIIDYTTSENRRIRRRII